MRVLLDTHVFLWWITGDSRLSDRAYEVIKEAKNEVSYVGKGFTLGKK